MSKLNILFKEAKKNKKKIFIGFVTSGDPNYKSSKEIIKEMTKYASERKQFNKSIGNFGQISAMLADSRSEMLAGQALCLDCAKKFELEPIHQTFKENQEPPICLECNGLIKTATISFGQPMPEKEMMRAQNEAANCDLMIAVGSSLVVYPAATIPLIGKHAYISTAKGAPLHKRTFVA